MRFEFNDDSQKICNSADVVNYGIQCDICGNKFQNVSNINGRRYCAGCYYKTFMKDNQQAEIDQLKQQLAEKEKELLKQKEKSARTEQIYNRIIVDKDKEIEKLKQQYTILENENGKLTTELIMDKYKKAQKEVSFGKQLAIQELEKVKILIQNAINFVRPNFVEVYDAINNQIKALKGNNDEPRQSN